MLDGGAGVDPDAVEWELNEWDEFSLEVALQLSEAQGDGEVVVISIGDEEAEEGLRACLAKGADRALRVWEDQLGGLRPPVGGSRAGRRGRAGVARPGAVRGPVERRRPRRDRGGARGASRVAARGRGQGARVRRRIGLGHRRARAGGRLGRAAARGSAGSAHDPDRNQRAALRQPACDQAGQGEAARGLGSIGVGARRRRGRGGRGLARTLHGSARFRRWGGDAQRLARLPWRSGSPRS